MQMITDGYCAHGRKVFTKGRTAWLRALTIAIIVTASFAVQGATLVHDFYLPLPEAQVRSTFVALQPTGIGTVIDSIYSIVVTAPGTEIYYDQWENGYEINLASPVQTNTLIWGDGINTNGIAPGFANDPTGLVAGTVLTLRNDVSLPRNPAMILYDGRDRVAATKAIVVARAAWAKTPGTVLATAVEVPATIDYGRQFICPVGQDVVSNANAMFEYAGLFVMAGEDGTTVTIDQDGAGPSNSVSVVLNRGESYHFNGGIMKGATINASKPVQVHEATGDIGANYESRWFRLYPIDQWYSSYLTPVGTSSNGNPAYIFLFNTNSNPLTINYDTRAGSGTFVIPANNGLSRFQMPANSGGRFTCASNLTFQPIETVSANPSANNVYDWGLTLVPVDGLTTEAVVGWGPGSSDYTQNGSPVWVTPLTATRVYVDYKGDGKGSLTNAAGRAYDVAYDLAALESKRVYTVGTNDQTAMRLYTLDGSLIAAAWGEDAAVAGPANPYIDAGTTIIPFPTPSMRKTSTLFKDNPPAGLSSNDVLEYTITVENKGLLPLGNQVVLDELPVSLIYSNNSTTLDGVTIPDHLDTTPFPLGAPNGYTIPIILRGGTSVFKFRTTIARSGSIVNSGFSGDLSVSNEIVVPTGGAASTCTVAFVDASTNDATVYFAGSPIYIKLVATNANSDASTTQTITALVQDLTSGDYQTITLRETGTNTSVFVIVSPLPTSIGSGLPAEDGTLFVSAGDSLRVSYTDPLLIPCSDTATVVALTPTKILYLNSTNQILNRIDPATAGWTNTLQSVELGAPSGGATVTNTIGVDNSTSWSNSVVGDNSGSTNTFTKAFTVGTGMDRLMLVGVAENSAQGGSGGGGFTANYTVSYAGQPLRLIIGQSNLALNVTGVQIWGLTNPPSGSNNLVLSVYQKKADIGLVYGVTAFSNVLLSAVFRSTNAVTGTGTSSSLVVTSAVADRVYDVVAVGSALSLSNGTSQTRLWTNANSSIVAVAGGSSSQPGASRVTNSWSWSGSQAWAAAGVSMPPSTSTVGGAGIYATTFTQSPPFALSFTMPSNSLIQVTNFVTVVTGAMPASPSNIWTILSYAGTNFITLTNAAYNSGTSNLVWTGTLTNNVNIGSNQTISMTVTTFQSGVSFKLDYGSSNKVSKILLPTTNVIAITDFGIFDAPYPGTNRLTGAANGALVYVRSVVTDPFGAYDISSVSLRIVSPSGVTNTFTLTNSYVVASNSYSKTYEYAWQTTAEQGTYALRVIANEGTEGIQAVAATTFPLSFLDLGTPSTTEFTTGANGTNTDTYGSNETVFVRVTDLDQNTNTNVAETVTVVITNILNGDYEVRTLTETGPNTGIFTGSVLAVWSGTATNNNGTLTDPGGSPLHVDYVDPTDPTDTSSDDALVPAPPGIPGLNVTKTLVSPPSGPASIGDIVQFNINIINTGSTTQNTVLVRDVYPTNVLTFYSSIPPTNSTAGGTSTWNNVGPLNPGQQTNISISFTAIGVAAPATNLATAAGTVTNTSSATVLITQPALTVTKTIMSPVGGTVSVGSNVLYRISIRNNGSTLITSLPWEDGYSATFFDYVSASNAPDFTGAGSLLWTNVGPLASGATYTNFITLKAKGGTSNALNTVNVDYAVDQYGSDVPPGSSSTGITMVAASINGIIYYDQDTNNILSGGDVGLSGISVSLYTDPNGDGNPADGTLVGLVPSSATGYYEFLNLSTGSYVAVQSALLIYSNLLETGTAPNNDNRIPVNVTNLTTYAGNNFLDVLPVTILVNVFDDINGNGTQEGTDTNRIVGATVVLLDANSNVVSTATTTAGGYVSFTNLLPGTYRILETNAAGYVSTSPTNDQFTVTVWSGETVSRTFLDSAYATISGSVYVDLNGNGVAEAGDTNGIGGVTVQLLNATSNVIAVSTTTGSGVYSFTNVPPGSYTVRELDPTAYLSTLDTAAPNDNLIPVVLNSGDNSAGNNFWDSLLAVSVTKTLVSPVGRPAAVGETNVFVIAVTNTGNAMLDQVSVTDIFSTVSMSYVSAVPPANVTNTGSVVWTNLGPLGVGAGTVITARFATVTSGIETNVAESTATLTNGVPVPTSTSTVPYTVVSPMLGVTKTVVSPVDRPAEIGEQMIFRIVATNAGDVTLNAVALTDTFNSNLLSFVSATPPVNTTNADNVVWTNMGSLAVGGSVTVTSIFTAIKAGIGTNAVDGFATLTNGVPVPGATNSVAHTNVQGQMLVSVSKSWLSDSQTNTVYPDLTIGERVVYRIRVDVSNGVATNLVIQDLVPDGLDWVGNNPNAGVSFPGLGYQFIVPTGGPVFATNSAQGMIVSDPDSSPASSIDNDGSGSAITFTIPAITNVPDGISSNNYFFLDMEFVVLDDSDFNVGINPVIRSYSNGVNVADSFTNLAAYASTYRIAEHDLRITKYMTPQVGDAGDLVTITFVVSNRIQATSSAYDVQVSDLISSTFYNNSSFTNLSTPANWTWSTNYIGGDLEYRLTSDPGTALAVGQVVTGQFQIALASTVQPGMTWSNIAALAASDTIDGTQPVGIPDRDKTSSAYATLSVSNASLSKTLWGTSETNAVDSDGSDVQIGEVVTYALTVTLPESTVTNLALTDLIPSGMRYLTNRVDTTTLGGSLPLPPMVTGGDSNGAPVTLTFNGASVIDGDNNAGNNSFGVQLDVLVLDTNSNRGVMGQQAAHTNQASLTFAGNTLGPMPFGNSCEGARNFVFERSLG